MPDWNPEAEQDPVPRVPTIAEERHFLEQCEYVNRSRTALGVLMRRLLRERGWKDEWCREDNEMVWSKTFPDGTTQHLGMDDAYDYEEGQARQFFRDTGLAMKPRQGQTPPAREA